MFLKINNCTPFILIYVYALIAQTGMNNSDNRYILDHVSELGSDGHKV